ncbi:MAG: hypothetical protein J4G11_00605 [Acidimicrobiia bacterium]|nr:hypothetical protein [Acidimicrobiia bacterium]
MRRDGPIRFFFDESALGIGQVMATARSDCVFPTHPRSPIRAGTDDADWIPEASSRGWIVVGRDKKIRTRPAEWAVLAQYPLRMLVLTTVGNLDVWGQLRVLVACWDRIEELSTAPAPWMYAVTKNGLREMEYPR